VRRKDGGHSPPYKEMAIQRRECVTTAEMKIEDLKFISGRKRWWAQPTLQKKKTLQADTLQN
jgi:hypothetical protein